MMHKEVLGLAADERRGFGQLMVRWTGLCYLHEGEVRCTCCSGEKVESNKYCSGKRGVWSQIERWYQFSGRRCGIFGPFFEETHPTRQADVRGIDTIILPFFKDPFSTTVEVVQFHHPKVERFDMPSMKTHSLSLCYTLWSS
jgi:hypothetical protein